MQVSLPTRFVLAIAITLTVGGCSKSTEQLQQIALDAEQTAREARAHKDPKKARRAATEATDAIIRLRKISEATSQQTNAVRLDLGKAEAAAREAGFQAEIAQEEEDYRDAIGSLSAKLYRNSRPVVMGTFFGQLASAADAAGKLNTNETQTLSSTLAKQGWALVQLVGAAEPLSDGSPDWAATRTQLSIWRTNQPLELRAFLSLAFFSVGQLDVALTEFETIDASSVTNADSMRFYRMGRTLLYAQQGWNHLAAQEAARFSEATDKEAKEAGRFMVAGLHGFMAYEAGKKRKFARMDSEIAQVVRAWPESPFIVYLTGEKLAANGEWERAAESLEARVAGTKDEWMAKRLAERARELRDGRGSTKAFVLDARFLIPFIARGLTAQTENSDIGNKLSSAMDQARNLGNDLLDYFKLPGGKNSAKAEAQEKSTHSN